MERWTTTVLFSLSVLIVGFPAVGWAQAGSAAADNATEETDDEEETDESSKNWSVSGSITSRVGQGTFVGLRNETNTEGELKPNGTAFDRANLIYRLQPSYSVGEFTFGAQFSMVQWLTAGAGTSATASSGGANDPGDVYIQDTTLSGSWRGYTFDSIGLNLAPSLEVGLPTWKVSQNNTKLFHLGARLSLSKRFFERLTLQGLVGFTKYFHRYKTSAIDPSEVGQDNVLFRSGEAEDLGNGLVALGGYNLSHLLSFGGNTKIKIWKGLSGSISYFFVNYYSYKGSGRDELSSEYARPNRVLSQAVSTSAKLSYRLNKYLRFSGGIGSFMSPKTTDNKSFRFPFWNTEGAAANRSWVQLGVKATY